MAKLYWRVKLNGKWTWRPARVSGRRDDLFFVRELEEEE